MSVTPTFMICLTAYWVLKELGKHRIARTSKLFLIFGYPYSWTDIVVTPLSIIVVALFAWQCLNSTRDPLTLHAQNLLLLFAAIALSQAIRAFGVSTRWFKQFLPSYVNVAHVGILNFVGVLYIYSAAFSASRYAISIAWLLIIINALRILKYRIYDDFVAANLDRDKARFGHVFIVMIFDVVLRTLLAVTMAFALACLLLIDRPELGAAKSNVSAFNIANPSENLFVDLLYFAVVALTTTGFGDITPITPAAKLITSVFMLFGYLLFATIIGLAVSIAFEARTR